MIRLGLCCIFRDEPIKFRTTTATFVQKLTRVEGLARISSLCLENARSLMAALQFCDRNGIGCFRINSQILPLKTHPVAGYLIEELPDHEEIVRAFKACGDFARRHRLRTCFHPDQFVVLNSRKPEVVASSLRELEYQAEVAEWVGADVINIHAGGAFGDKTQSLLDFARSVESLSDRARSRLTIENDDKVYAPADLLPLCRALQLPLVYDVHHHRCHPDGLSVEEATADALTTWSREPLFHLSSPIDGWSGVKPQRHHDFIDVNDFPVCWLPLDLTVEVEAKAKEVAVARLKNELDTTLRLAMIRRDGGSNVSPSLS